MLVHRYNVCTTNLYVYEVLVPSTMMGPYSTICTRGDQWYGRLGTHCLPPELNALPSFSKERSEAVKAWQEAEYQKCYALIRKVFPGLVGHESMGKIDQTSDEKLPNGDWPVEG